MTVWNDVKAICPFYRSSETRRIRCEGLDEGSLLICFRCGENQKRHFQAHCADEWESCSVAEMLGRKYE